MAKKQNQKEEVQAQEEEFDNGNETEGTVDTSFDLDDDYKPEPLCRKGWYKGNVSEITINEEAAYIDWTVVLDGNGGYMSDGETPIDGTSHHFKNWLPKESDKTEITKSGKNKWQNKVNMLKKFADAMQISMKNMDQIRNELAEQNWVGMAVSIELAPETYQGNTTMRGQNMKLRTEE